MNQLLDRNLFNPDGSESLPVSAGPPVLLLALLLENDDLVGPIGFQDGRLDFRVGQWRAGLDVTAIFDHQHIAEMYLRSNLAFQLLEPDRLARLNPVLFAARFDHGVH